MSALSTVPGARSAGRSSDAGTERLEAFNDFGGSVTDPVA
jgi:hypothetical protein